MKDVAARAGVSMKTVSNVLNGYPFISPGTRARVDEALAALDYRPNMAARNLARGRTGAIALAIPHVDNPYFAELARHVIDEAGRYDLTVLVDQTGGDRDGERRALEGLPGRLVDGLVLSPMALRTADLEERAGATPMVLLGERVSHTTHADHVAIDDVAASRDAVRHLLDRGRSRVAVVGDQPHRGGTGPSARRLRGARAAVAERGGHLAPSLVAETAEYTREDGARAMDELLGQGTAPDAVFCCNDVLAMGALSTLHRRGVRVPDDVAVVGFDDIDECRFSVPPLTSVSADKQAVAHEAVTRLVAVLAGPDAPRTPQDVTLPHRLVVRESSGGA